MSDILEGLGLMLLAFCAAMLALGVWLALVAGTIAAIVWPIAAALRWALA